MVYPPTLPLTEYYKLKWVEKTTKKITYTWKSFFSLQNDIQQIAILLQLGIRVYAKDNLEEKHIHDGREFSVKNSQLLWII